MEKKVIFLSFIILFGFAPKNCLAKYSGGNGSESTPYRISNAYDINAIGADSNDWGSHFVMVNDINLAQFTGTQFNIVGNHGTPFTGVFDGNGFTISNFTYTSRTSSIGLFGYVNDINSVIKNLTLINPDVNAGRDSVGSLIGWLRSGAVTNCSVEGGNVSGVREVGGLVGRSLGTIINCDVTGNVDGVLSTGGLVGSSLGTISDCNASVSVTGIISFTGGLVGSNSRILVPYIGKISNCYATGNVSGNKYVGGLVGKNKEGVISNCYATGNVDGNDYTGGLIGIDDSLFFGFISDCYATGDVNGNNCTGGLVGAGGRVLDSYATGDVNGYNSTGGLVGSFAASVKEVLNCYAAGNVSGNNHIGGLVGDNSGWISNCYTIGDVEGNDNVGGLVGYNTGSTFNCYAIGAVSGNDNIGGLVGYNGQFFGPVQIISDCYAAGAVNGNNNIGGLIGCYDNGGLTICFWNSDVNLWGLGNWYLPFVVIGKSTAEMQTESTFTDAGWDFSTPIWKMCYDPDYPHLWWEQCPKPSLEVSMHFTPRVLNPKSKGKWVKAHLILPEGFTAGDVNTNSPARIIEPFTAESVYMDVFEDGLVKIMAAFDRAVFCSNGSMLEDIVVIARLTTGQYFYGTDTIRIKTNNLEYLAVLISHWLAADCGEPDWCAGADLNRDSVVDFIDFAFFDGCCLEFIKN